MVESNDLVTIYFGTFDSIYSGSPIMIGGNQIYSAIIKSYGINAISDISKVSHGIYHFIPIENIDYYGKVTYDKSDWKGWHVGNHINLDGKSVSTYSDFMSLRQYQTPFIKDIQNKKTNVVCSEPTRILKKHTFSINDGNKIKTYVPDRISFFIISKNDPCIEVGDNIQLGAHRNLGFGNVNITNKYTFCIDDLDYSCFGTDNILIATAKEGIRGILNHQKYGYGEFMIEKQKKNDNVWFIKLITPLCLSSTIENTRRYDTPPRFMYSYSYRQRMNYIWRKGKEEELQCISDGNVFVYMR